MPNRSTISRVCKNRTNFDDKIPSIIPENNRKTERMCAEIENAPYSQTKVRAYLPWTDFLSLNWGYLKNGFIILPKNITGTIRVICVTTAFAAIDHLLNEMISYVCVLRVAPLFSRVYVDENRRRLSYLCQRHILYLKRPHNMITE